MSGSGLEKLSGYLRNLFGIDVSGSNVDGIQHVTHWSFGNGLTVSVNEASKRAVLNTEAFDGGVVVQSQGSGRRVSRLEFVTLTDFPTTAGFTPSATLVGYTSLDVTIANTIGSLRLLKAGAIRGDEVALRCQFAAGQALAVQNETAAFIVNESVSSACVREYVLKFNGTDWYRFSAAADQEVLLYRDSMHVAGRALLPKIANARVGSRVTVGSLGDEFVAVVSGTYPEDNEFVIAGTASPGIKWVWRNPETGRLRFDPSDSPKWVCGISAERALLRHGAGTIGDAIVDGAISQGTEVVTSGSGGTPTLSPASFGGKPGITFNTSSWMKFALTARVQPGQSWGFLIATSLQATTGSRNILDIDGGQANDSNTYRLATYDSTSLFNVFVLNGASQFNSVANSDLMLSPYRGNSSVRTARQVLGVFGDCGYKSYVDSRLIAEKQQSAYGALNTGSAVCWINRQANGYNGGYQTVHRIDLYSGNPGDGYLRNYDKFIHAGLTDKRVLCLGDSITCGYPLTNAQSWPTIIGADADLLAQNYLVENHGISGWQTANVLKSLDSKIGPNAAIEGRVLNGKTIVLLMIGINDCASGRTSLEIIDNIFSTCDRLKANGAYVVLSTLLPATAANLDYTGQTKRSYINRAIIAEGLNHANAIFQGHRINSLSDPSSVNYADGLHLSAAGAVVYASAIKPMVQAFVKTPGKILSVRRLGDTSSMTSTDGGTTWTTNTGAIADANWYWIAYDQNYNRHIVIANGSAYVAFTNNGGASWTTNASALKGATSFYKAVFCKAFSRTIVVSEVGNVCNYSTNGGETWTDVLIGGTEHPWWGIACDDAHGAVVAVSDEPDNSTIRTVDGGDTWSPGGSLAPIFGDVPSGAIVYDEKHECLVLLSHSQKTAISRDGGQTWLPGGDLPDSRYWDSAELDKKTGRIVTVSCTGSDRITAYSSDGGVTWTRGGTIPGITTGYFRQLVSDPVRGRTIGPHYSSTPPKYIYTDDGGETWGVIEATGSSSTSGTAMGIVPY